MLQPIGSPRRRGLTAVGSAGPYDNLVRLAQSEELDYETEISVVIGHGGRHPGRTGVRPLQNPPVWLRGGDVVRMEITGPDRMETPIADES